MQIKFRMWNCSSYIYDHKIVMNAIIQQAQHNDDPLYKGYDHERSGRVFEQFTGIKDNNGTDIYVGDIINDSEELFIIKFSEYDNVNNNHGIGFYAEHTISKECSWICSDDTLFTRVVGNIHENKNLLP